MSDTIYEAVKAAAAADHAREEQAAEEAIQGGEHGVLIVRDPDTQRIVSATVDPRVPYGHLYRVPSTGLDAFDERYGNHPEH